MVHSVYLMFMDNVPMYLWDYMINENKILGEKLSKAQVFLNVASMLLMSSLSPICGQMFWCSANGSVQGSACVSINETPKLHFIQKYAVLSIWFVYVTFEVKFQRGKWSIKWSFNGFNPQAPGKKKERARYFLLL